MRSSQMTAEINLECRLRKSEIYVKMLKGLLKIVKRIAVDIAWLWEHRRYLKKKKRIAVKLPLEPIETLT